MGLMQVMKNLANIDEVGRGIAAAFVATVYGVGIANLFFLPAGGKMKARLRGEVQIRELMLEGVLAIVEGLNPKLIRTRLDAYLDQPASAQEEGAPATASRRPPARGGGGLILARKKKAAGAREPRALAGLLRRFHHPAVCLLRGDVRLFADR